MSETSNITLDETIEAAFPEDETSLSPYALAGRVNELLASFGVDKSIPTQMAYNYINNGLIKGVSRKAVETKKGGTRQAVSVSREGAVEWVKKYISKNVTK